MSIRTLRTLIAVSERGSFSAAADAVHVTHAAVSQQMKALEEDLRIAVFDRSRRSPELTSAGKALVVKAREVIRAYDALGPSILGKEAISGELVLGALPTTLSGLIPAALAALRRGYPDLRIRVVPGLSIELMAQVERGALDGAVVTRPAEGTGSLDWRSVVEEPFELIASPDTVSNDPIDLLESQPYIRFTRRALVGGMVDAWLRKRRIAVREAMELDTLETISSMVFHGLGVSIVPKSCVPGPNILPLKRISLAHVIEPRELGVIARADGGKPRIIDALLAQLTIVSGAGVQTTD